MKRICLILITAFFMAMCGTANKTVSNNNESKKRSDVQYRDDFKPAGTEEKNALLKNLNAEGGTYSVLIFTQNYKGERIIVSNSKKRLYSDYTISNLKTGIAGQLRIDNTFDTKVYDNLTKRETVIEAKEAQKHKFIYLMKNPGSNNAFTITYSNTLRPLE